MFTGIIEETGTVGRLEITGRSGRMTIRASKVLEGTGIGDSIAVNGICLTVTDMTDRSFTADVMAETVRRSSLSALHAGSRVNLERAMAAGGRFGGHFVTGHIDGTGVITSMRREENAVWIGVRCGEQLARLICEKGSIAIDGISLTVAGVTDDGFRVSVIPHTGEETTLLGKKTGDVVNLENDILAKYTDRLLSFGRAGKEEAGSVDAGDRSLQKTENVRRGGHVMENAENARQSGHAMENAGNARQSGHAMQHAGNGRRGGLTMEDLARMGF